MFMVVYGIVASVIVEMPRCTYGNTFMMCQA